MRNDACAPFTAVRCMDARVFTCEPYRLAPETAEALLEKQRKLALRGTDYAYNYGYGTHGTTPNVMKLASSRTMINVQQQYHEYY